MSRPIFYYNTIKNLIVTFGAIFDNVRYEDDFGKTIKIPIHYAPKEKFVSYFYERPDFEKFNVEQVFPRMAFEMTGLNFAPERFMSPLSKMTDSRTEESHYMLTRIPYDFQFTLYLATKKFEDSLKVVEQIVPFFTPELNVTIKDKEDFTLRTDVPVVLNSVGYEIDYEGGFETKRTILWTLGFTMKAWLYSDVRKQETIKETIMNLTQTDIDDKFATLTSEVVPREASRHDPHTVEDKREGFV